MSLNIGDLIQGNTKIRVEQRGWGRCFQQKPALFLKRGKIGPRLLLMTNKKLHTHFTIGTEINDLAAVCFKTRVSFGAHHENLNEDRPTLSAAKR